MMVRSAYANILGCDEDGAVDTSIAVLCFLRMKCSRLRKSKSFRTDRDLQKMIYEFACDKAAVCQR